MSVALPDIPSDLAGWAWRRTTAGGALLEAPDGWQTKEYTKSVNKAIGEARRRKIEQAKHLDHVPAHLDPRLPKLPPLLEGWSWDSEGGAVRLAHPTEGWATGFRAFLLASDAIAEALQIVARDAALVAEAEPIRRAPPLRLSTTSPPATAWQPGPDAGGVYRRPPGMPEYTTFPPRDLVDGRWQPRVAYGQEALDELTASITEHGVTTPLLVLINELGEPELIAGHRRKRAALAAGGRDVPARVLEVTAAQAFEIAVIENDQRSDLTDIERGQAYEKMIAELGISEAKLAEKLGRPRAYIQQRRMLAAACPELQTAVTSSELGFTQARAICLGSGGDHTVQAAVTAYALAEIRADRPEPATRLQARAEQTVRERHAKDLAKLGWKFQKFWRNGGDLHLYWARTAKPAVWSSGEILATVREARRPPDGPEPTLLTAEDRAALEVVGWRVFVENYCAPWAIIERAKEVAIGDAGDLAEHVAAARQALAQIAARFEARGWQIQPTGGRLKLTPPIPEPEPGSKKKPKKLAPVEGRLADAEKLIKEVEAGTWKPEPAKSSSSSSGTGYTCKRCKVKMGWSEMEYIDHDYHCKGCAADVKVEQATLKAKLATAIDQQLGAWLDTAPDLAAMLVVLRNGGSLPLPEGPERGKTLREAFTEWLWNNRERFKFVEQAPASAPATAVAPPPAETPAAAGPLTFDELVAAVAAIESRWAAGDGEAGDPDRLNELAHQLDDLAEEEAIPTEAFEDAQRRLGELLARVDEEGVPT